MQERPRVVQNAMQTQMERTRVAPARSDSSAEEAIARESSERYRELIRRLNRMSDRDIDRALKAQ